MVSQYLARLPDRATNMYVWDALLGDTSLTAGVSSLASCSRCRDSTFSVKEGLEFGG